MSKDPQMSGYSFNTANIFFKALFLTYDCLDASN